MFMLNAIFALIAILVRKKRDCEDPTPMTPAEIDAALDDRVAELLPTMGPLNHRLSVVDLFKTLGLDPSLQNRREVAISLGFPGVFNGSADDNVWLIKKIREEFGRGNIAA